MEGNFGGGLTPKGEWDSFFNKDAAPIIPSPDMSSVPESGYRVVGGTMLGESLAPEVPQDAAGMARDFESSPGFAYEKPQPAPMPVMPTADDYLNEVLGETWFDQGGNINPGGPTRSGTTFVSPYGTGTVRYASPGEKKRDDTASRLKRLAEQPFQPFADLSLL